jgi:hypothetical protein
MEEAHAIVCERSQWACNEKHLIETADLMRVQNLFSRVPVDPESLAGWIDRIARELGVPIDEATAWK